MKITGKALILRVFIGESDKHGGKSLYEAIVLKARELNLAGATVLKGILGFGAHSRLHAAKLLTLSEDLPIIVEIVESEENIGKILPFIDSTVDEGLVTIEQVEIFKYRHGS
jgi:uncharacterized protein